MTQIPRPEINYEMKLAAAKKVAKQMQDADAETIAYNYECYMDGYELARELDRMCGWDITAQDVEALDSMGVYIDQEHEVVCKKWFFDNDIKPQFTVGTQITRGVITGICSYSVGKYLVREYGDIDSETMNRRLLIKFEDAEEV